MMEYWKQPSLLVFHAMENFSPNFPRYGKLFSTPWKTPPGKVGTARRAVRAVPSAVRRTWHQRIFFGFGRGCPAPTSALFPAPGFVATHARCPQDVDAEDFFRVWAGSHAKITAEFSGDAALRATRTGLVSVRCRPQNGRTEKAAVGFRAAKTRTKSSLPNPHPTHHA